MDEYRPRNNRRGVATTALPTEARQPSPEVGGERSVPTRGQPAQPAGSMQDGQARTDAPAPDSALVEALKSALEKVRPRNARITTFRFQATASDQQVMPDNSERNYLALQNRGSTAVFVAFGSKADSNAFRLVAGGFYEPYIPPNTSLHIMGSSGGEEIVIFSGQ